MNRVGLVGMLWLALAGWGGAEPVVLRSSPPGATVKDVAGNAVGVTPMVLEFEQMDHANVGEFQLHLEGHEPARLLLRADTLENLRLSVAQPVVLKPRNLWVGLGDVVRHPPSWALALLGVSGVALAALGMLLVRRRPATEEMRRTLLESVALDSIGSLFSERFGQYQLVDRLGEGGMATVYRAVPYDTLDEKAAVAIKVIARKLAEEEEYTRRFLREIDICRTLDHPNIVRLIDWGERDERVYLVLEFVRGTTLAAKLAAQPILPPEDVKAILEGLMAGLVYAHNRGVVHRDLKPENLMLTENGVLKVMDFGLARGEGSGKLTRTGTAMGTPAYMAPEQIQDQPFDARTDQYAVGMIVYQMLAGRLPFEGDDIMKLLFAQVSQKPEPPSQYNPRLPDEVDAVVLRMLEKRREDRFATSEEAAQWLFQALEGYR